MNAASVGDWHQQQQQYHSSPSFLTRMMLHGAVILRPSVRLSDNILHACPIDGFLTVYILVLCFGDCSTSEDSGFDSRAGFSGPVGPTVRRLTTKFFWEYFLLSFQTFSKRSCFVVRRLTVGPTGLMKPARESNPESSDVLHSPKRIKSI